MACYQISEKSKRIFCRWTAVPDSLDYVAFLLDSDKNVIEKIQVNEPHVTFHGRLLKFDEVYEVEVGGFRRTVELKGMSVSIAFLKVHILSQRSFFKNLV